MTTVQSAVDAVRADQQANPSTGPLVQQQPYPEPQCKVAQHEWVSCSHKSKTQEVVEGTVVVVVSIMALVVIGSVVIRAMRDAGTATVRAGEKLAKGMRAMPTVKVTITVTPPSQSPDKPAEPS